MNTYWTFTDNDEWVHESYPTKEEAIKEGRLQYDGTFYVGQLFGNDDKGVYKVDNVEEINN